MKTRFMKSKLNKIDLTFAGFFRNSFVFSDSSYKFMVLVSKRL